MNNLNNFRFNGSQNYPIQNIYKSDVVAPLSRDFKNAPLMTMSEDISVGVKLYYSSEFSKFTVRQFDGLFTQDPRIHAFSEFHNQTFSISAFGLQMLLKDIFKRVKNEEGDMSLEKAYDFIKGVHDGKWDMYGKNFNDEKLVDDYREEYLMLEPKFVNEIFKFRGPTTGENMYHKQTMIDTFENSKKRGRDFSMLENVILESDARMRNFATGYIFPGGLLTLYFGHEETTKFSYEEENLKKVKAKLDLKDKGPVILECLCSVKYNCRPFFLQDEKENMVLDHEDGKLEVDTRPSQKIGMVLDWNEYSKKPVRFINDDFNKYIKESEITPIKFSE